MSWNRTTPNQSLFSSLMAALPQRLPPDLFQRRSMAHLQLKPCQQGRPSASIGRSDVGTGVAHQSRERRTARGTEMDKTMKSLAHSDSCDPILPAPNMCRRAAITVIPKSSAVTHVTPMAYLRRSASTTPTANCWLPILPASPSPRWRTGGGSPARAGSPRTTARPTAPYPARRSEAIQP